MRKNLLGFILLLVLAVIFTACGGTGETTTDSDTAADEVASTTEEDAGAEEEPTLDPNMPTPEPTPVVNAFGDCDDPLILWHGLTGTDGAVFADMLEKFVNEVPGACLSSEGIPWDIFFQKYQIVLEV